MSNRGILVLFISMALGWVNLKTIDRIFSSEEEIQGQEFRSESETENYTREIPPSEGISTDKDIVHHYI